MKEFIVEAKNIGKNIGLFLTISLPIGALLCLCVYPFV